MIGRAIQIAGGLLLYAITAGGYYLHLEWAHDQEFREAKRKFADRIEQERAERLRATMERLDASMNTCNEEQKRRVRKIEMDLIQDERREMAPLMGMVSMEPKPDRSFSHLIQAMILGPICFPIAVYQKYLEFHELKDK